MGWNNSPGEAEASWDTPAATKVDGSWNAGGTGTANEGGDAWGSVGDTGANGHDGYGATNGNHESGEGGGGDSCRNCGQSGHFARECTEPRKQGGDCFNCGQSGHSKAECPSPRVFTGTCRICDKAGHPAAECPDKPAEICRNCKKEGHQAKDCKDDRVFDLSSVANKNPEDAWIALQTADQERDLDDFRDALKVYSKAVPDSTYDQLEQALRRHKMNMYIIASEKEKSDAFTLINLQGKLDCTYQIGYFFSPNPKRGRSKEGWPANPQDNLERLKDAGVPMERGIPKCSNCEEMGHTAKFCKEEKREVLDRVEVKCVNCEEAGHRARDCTKPRIDRFACRNCKQSGHTSTECTEPRSAEGVECKRCNEVGHFAKDCPTGGSQTCRNCGGEGHISKECDQPRNPATVTCRNCEEIGHFSKDCTKKKDYSKMKCNNCGEMGHTVARCNQPVASTKDAGFGGSGDNDGFSGDNGGFDPTPAGGDTGDAGDWDSAPVAGGGASW